MPNTTNFGWNMPTEFADSDTWGGELNALFQLMDDATYSLLTAPAYAVAAGTDTLTVTLDPAPNAYVDGFAVRFKAANTNTAAVTLNVNSLGAVSIKYADGSALAAGALVSGVQYLVVHNGTNFVLSASAASPATAAETLTGTDITKFITPAGLAANKSLAANGYYKLPGGFTIQWGATSTSITGESSETVTFPVAFATSCAFAIASPNNPAASSGNDGHCQLVSKSTTGAIFRMQDVGGTLSGVTWAAFGY